MFALKSLISLTGLFVLVVSMAMMAPAADAKSPKAAPQLQRIIDVVLARAKPSVNKSIAPGVVLRRARSYGNIVMFDTELTDPVLLNLARNDKPAMQKFFAENIGTKFCRKGSGTRSFIDMGGEIQLVFQDRRRNMLAGGRLTGC